MRQLVHLLEPYHDLFRLARMRRRFGTRLRIAAPECPFFWRTDLRIEAGARAHIGPELLMERRRTNQIWLHRDSVLELGRRVWLRTEHGENQITLFEGAHVQIGDRSLLNGAMLHAKAGIRIGREARIGFGVRILDADLHDLDASTPERIAPVSLGDRVWLGANSLVLRGVAIGDDVIVGAGSVVTRDLPSRVLAVGAPARVVRSIGSREGCR